MYICICRAVTDQQIRNAAADGVGSMRELSFCLGVAENCGKCGKLARQILDEEIALQREGEAPDRRLKSA
ncbi:MAG: bacterioferritin-associated ferredoxin [Gammaproteobacteria bacterium]|nr:bacterioferritin-associated ferredoxin [Gammaproteobacteria bacterium]